MNTVIFSSEQFIDLFFLHRTAVNVWIEGCNIRPPIFGEWRESENTMCIEAKFENAAAAAMFKMRWM